MALTFASDLARVLDACDGFAGMFSCVAERIVLAEARPAPVAPSAIDATMPAERPLELESEFLLSALPGNEYVQLFFALMGRKVADGQAARDGLEAGNRELPETLAEREACGADRR